MSTPRVFVVSALTVSALAVSAAVVVFGGWSQSDLPSFSFSAAAFEPQVVKVTEPPPVRQKQIMSRPYEIDRIYKSMKGPYSNAKVLLLETEQPEVLWITGAHVLMVDGESTAPAAPEFMCHANLDLNTKKHNQLLGLKKGIDGRLFTLSQGQLDVEFPLGFGIPVRSDLALSLNTQVLNLNIEADPFKVRHQVTLDFVRDRELKQPMNALFESGIFAMKSLEGRELVYDMVRPDDATAKAVAGEPCKSCCLPGQKANHTDESKDRHGRKFTGHWIVKPGREVNRTRVTTLMGLPFDTTIHHIAVHLHPFAESLELIDLTTGQSLFKSEARNFDDKIGLKHVDHFSSEAGIPVFLDHEYELISTYNNTSDEDQDSMAVMYLYLFDKEFHRVHGH